MIHINDLVVLCVCSTHQRHREIGRIVYQDLDSGDMGVKFTDGNKLNFPDMGKDNEWHPIQTYYRHNDETGAIFDQTKQLGPKSLKAEYLKLGGDWEKFLRDYLALFGEQFSVPA